MSDIYDRLSRRERQVMDILLELGEATAKQVHARLPDRPSYSAARALLTKLEEKQVVRHGERELRYVYRPAVSREQARGSAVERLVRVFFGGSLAKAVHGMVGVSAEGLTDEELDEIEAAISRVRRSRGR